VVALHQTHVNAAATHSRVLCKVDVRAEERGRTCSAHTTVFGGVMVIVP